MSEPLTLFDKLWAAHEIVRRDDGEALLWVDRHYVHEGSFNAFSQLKARGARVAEPGLTFGVADHYVPTRGSRRVIDNPEVARMVRTLEENTAEHGITLFGLGDPRQGIVHVVGPEQGLTLPGLLVVCGDSHTSTHGALGAYAFEHWCRRRDGPCHRVHRSCHSRAVDGRTAYAMQHVDRGGRAQRHGCARRNDL